MEYMLDVNQAVIHSFKLHGSSSEMILNTSLKDAARMPGATLVLSQQENGSALVMGLERPGCD